MIIPKLVDLKFLVVSQEVSLVLKAQVDLLEGTQLQDRVVPEALVVLEEVPEVSQVLQVQVDLVQGIQLQDREVRVVLEVPVELEADPEASQVLQAQVHLLEGTQVQDRVVPEVSQVLQVQVDLVEGTQLQDRGVQAVQEVPVDLKADPEVFQVQEVQVHRVEVIQVQGRKDQVVLEGSQVPVVLEVRLVDSQFRGHQVDRLRHHYPTHSSHLVEALDHLSQTENTYRLTTDNDFMTTNRSYLNVHKFLRSVFTIFYFCYVLIDNV
jgi:hypothetical protein